MHSRLAGISKKILTSYEAVGGLNNTDRHNLPSKRAVDSLCEQLLQVLFPGFHDEQPIHKNELAETTHIRLEALAERLGAQIARSIRLNDPKATDADAVEVLLRFLDQIPAIRELLRTDIQAAFEGDPAATSDEEIILSYPCLSSVRRTFFTTKASSSCPA